MIDYEFHENEQRFNAYSDLSVLKFEHFGLVLQFEILGYGPPMRPPKLRHFRADLLHPPAIQHGRFGSRLAGPDLAKEVILHVMRHSGALRRRMRRMRLQSPILENLLEAVDVVELLHLILVNEVFRIVAEDSPSELDDVGPVMSTLRLFFSFSFC